MTYIQRFSELVLPDGKDLAHRIPYPNGTEVPRSDRGLDVCITNSAKHHYRRPRQQLANRMKRGCLSENLARQNDGLPENDGDEGALD